MPPQLIRHTMGPVEHLNRWFVWILGPHSEPGGTTRTHLGNLVVRAKYYGDQAATRDLVRAVQRALADDGVLRTSRHGLGELDAVAAVPFATGKRDVTNSLPHHVASAVASTIPVADISSVLERVEPRQEAKRGAVVETSWFRCSTQLDGGRILLTDDLFRTGSPLRAVSSCLLRSGAESVVGLCLTRAYSGLVFR